MAHQQLTFRAAAREKVLRGATALAVSVAGVLPLTEAPQTELPEPKPETPQAAEGL